MFPYLCEHSKIILQQILGYFDCPPNILLFTHDIFSEPPKAPQTEFFRGLTFQDTQWSEFLGGLCFWYTRWFEFFRGLSFWDTQWSEIFGGLSFWDTWRSEFFRGLSFETPNGLRFSGVWVFETLDSLSFSGLWGLSFRGLSFQDTRIGCQGLCKKFHASS